MITPRSFKFFLFLACFVGLVGVASAQKAEDFSNSLNFDDLQSPQVNIAKGKGFKPKDWLEIEFSAKLDNVPPANKNEPFHDSVTVSWNIILKGQDRKTYWVKKTVEHVNVPADEEIFFSVYLSPNTIKRITGKDRGGKNDLEAVGGDISINGARAGFFKAGKFKAGWWTADAPKTVTVTQKFPLLSKDQTPFKLFWYDRYAEIRQKDQ